MGLLADVKTFLTGISNVSLGSLPDSPDNAVSIHRTNGYPRDLSGNMVEEPTVMIKVRNTSYATGETLCNTIKDALHGQNNVTVNTNDILLIEQMGDINELGRDENNRQMWSINFRLYYRR